MLEDDRAYAHVCAYMKGFLRVRDKPSVYEVARLAGVSTATVSRVLAGYERVLPRTRDKVLTAVTELGYVPSGAARELAARRSGVIGLGFPDLDAEATEDGATTDRHGYAGVCFIAGPPDSPDSARRLDGFRRATAGLPETPVYYGDFTTAGGRRIAERIIAAGRVPRALVCANDQTAIGVMAALQHAGLSVPGDVAVTGFDGIRLGRHLQPSLTTVVQPMAALGATAVAMLTDRIGGVGPSSKALPPQTLPRRTVELPVRLELRGSCGCAP